MTQAEATRISAVPYWWFCPDTVQYL